LEKSPGRIDLQGGGNFPVPRCGHRFALLSGTSGNGMKNCISVASRIQAAAGLGRFSCEHAQPARMARDQPVINADTIRPSTVELRGLDAAKAVELVVVQCRRESQVGFLNRSIVEAIYPGPPIIVAS
jgi:hypothetical protein